MKTWKDYYKLPLKLDEWCGYVWDEDNTNAICFGDDVKEEFQSDLIDCLNGKQNFMIDGLTYKGCDFFINDNYMFCVRGWGYLTGAGACNLSIKEATRIQDGFIEHIFNKLTN